MMRWRCCPHSEQKIHVPQSYHLGGAGVHLLGDDEHRHDEAAMLLPLLSPGCR